MNVQEGLNDYDLSCHCFLSETLHNLIYTLFIDD